MRTNHAAIGAATIPPSMRENTQTQLTCSQPSEMKNPIVAASETGNSLVSTDPITFLASFPLARRTGVVIFPNHRHQLNQRIQRINQAAQVVLQTYAYLK